MKKQPICLIIRDGWGRGKKEKSNAIYMAETPFTDEAEQRYPTTLIQTSGESVGLPAGYQGNSEVGHLNMGAGRIVYQNLTRIDNAIHDGSFYTNPVIIQAIKKCKNNHSTIHLIGLIQEEGIHAVTRHGLAILKICKNNAFDRVLIHGISDGRDTPPKSAQEHFDFLQKGIDKVGIGKIASVTGRYYAMDRDNRWDRTRLFYDCLTRGKGRKAVNFQEAIQSAYAVGETDEFIRPRVINYKGISPRDVIIFFNFRFDRTRQITRALVEKEFSHFPTRQHQYDFVAMTHYYDGGNFQEIFPEQVYHNILAQVLADRGLTQLRCSETEKYAHVTFFFNALNNEPFPLEDRILIDSPRVPTYDQAPQMSALKIRDRVIESIRKDSYDLIVCNLANCDMVGHTGIFEKIIIAVQTVDFCCREITMAMLEKGGICILSADHGNAEQTRLPDGSPMTSHTTNDTPCTIIGAGNIQLRDHATLADIAPTILDLWNIQPPPEMTGRSIIIKN